MYVTAAVNVKQHLIPRSRPCATHPCEGEEWIDIVKIGRTQCSDATPLTLARNGPGMPECWRTISPPRGGAGGVYRLALGGTAVGTGINSAPGFAEEAAARIAALTGLPFVSAPNKFTVQGSHDALVQRVGNVAHRRVSLYKIGKTSA